MRLGYGEHLRMKEWHCGSFNEAEAHAPRIHVCAADAQAVLALASMRPRRMRLGYNHHHPTAKSQSNALQ